MFEDQPTPTVSARLDKQPTFRQAAQLDWRETQLLRKRTHLRCCAVIVACQEHDSVAAMGGRSWPRKAATRWLNPLTSLAPVKACATALE